MTEPEKPPASPPDSALSAAPKLGEPTKPAVKPAATPPASAADLKKFVQDAVAEMIPRSAEDTGPVPDILPATAPAPPTAEEIDRLFSENKQGEAVSKAIAAASAASSPTTARLMRQDSFREVESGDELGPVYKKHRKRIHEALVSMRLTDAHLSTPQAVDAAVRLVVSQNSDMFDDLASQRATRRLAAAGTSASAAAPVTGPTGAGMPAARVEVPGAAPEHTAGAGDVVEDMDKDEAAMWVKMGLDPKEVSKEKERMRNAGKEGGPRIERAYGVEV